MKTFFAFLLTCVSLHAAQLTIGWTYASTAPLTGFVVKRAVFSANPNYVQVGGTLPGTARAYTDTSVLPGLSYTYEVLAVNAGIYGTPSTPLTTPVVPSDTTIIAPVSTTMLHPGDQVTFTNGVFKPRPNGPVTALSPNTSASTAALPQ